MDNSLLNRVNRRLGPIPRIQLIEDAADVNPHRFLRDIQLRGDIAIALPPRDQRQHQNTSGGGADGVGDEYAISAAANPAADQSAHR